MADIDLPVFSFRPDWKDGVIEHLSFLTDLLKSEEGAVQARALRLTPRRQIDADFLLVGSERTFYDLFMHRLGSNEIMVPLYWDVGRIGAASVAGVTDRLNFDTTHTEFAPGLAMLQGKSAMAYEVVEIESVDDTGVDLATATGRAWPKGTRIVPLRRSLIEDMGSLSHPSAAVSRVSAQFVSTVANPWDVPAEDAAIYKGFPVLTAEPNWVDNLDVQLARDAVRLDNGTGLPFQTDPIGRANVGQAHRYFLNGRAPLAKFRDRVYRQRGRARSFWLPTFKADLTLKASAGSGATQIVVENVGLNYVNAPTSGRDHLAIMLKNGTVICREIIDVDPGVTDATEKIDLDAPIGLALSPGQVRKISFLDRARFDQDSFEIVHHTESVGLSEVNTVFRTFKDSRDPSGVISYPIAPAVSSDTPCGEGDSGFDPCYYIPWPGWDFEILMVTDFCCWAPTVRDLYTSPVSGGGFVGVSGFNGVTGDLQWTNYVRWRGPDDRSGNGGVGVWGASTGGNFINPSGYGPVALDNRAHAKVYLRHWAGTSVLIWEQANMAGYGNLVGMPTYYNTLDWRDYR